MPPNPINPLSSQPNIPGPAPNFSHTSRIAYLTFLLTTPSYLPGILVLAHTLAKYTSIPLVVAINPALPSTARQVLEEWGLKVKVVQPLRPSGETTTIAERFVDTWTKCASFGFGEYDRLVLLDGDMLIRRPLDELFFFPMQADQIAATYGCVCNSPPEWAPVDWTRPNCAFTSLQPPRPTHNLLNSGTVVLIPSHSVMDRINSLLASTKAADQAKIRSWMFPDQDLLTEIFGTDWLALPWYYNAIKTFRYWHGTFYSDDEVRVLHYIVDKPWKRRPTRNSSAEKEKTGRVFAVECGEFEGVVDEVRGDAFGPSEETDAVTHGWWWEAWEEVLGVIMEKGMDTGFVEGLVAK